MSEVELKWRLIYALIVAGKSARFANEAVARLRALVPADRDPLRFLAERPETFRAARTGKYDLLAKAVEDLRGVRIDFRRCAPDLLETIRGIGPKTSRFFIAWTRPDARVAVLDRHVLRWLRARGHDVPEETPPPRRYAEIERTFLEEADRRGKTPRELDLEIWSEAATAPNIA